MAGEEATRREESDRLFVRSDSHDGSMGLALEEVPDLAVTEEELNPLFHHLLEDKIFVIVADFKNVSVNKVIDGGLPLGSVLTGLLKVVYLLLAYLSVKDLLVDART